VLAASGILVEMQKVIWVAHGMTANGGEKKKSVKTEA